MENAIFWMTKDPKYIAHNWLNLHGGPMTTGRNGLGLNGDEKVMNNDRINSLTIEIMFETVNLQKTRVLDVAEFKKKAWLDKASFIFELSNYTAKGSHNQSDSLSICQRPPF